MHFPRSQHPNHPFLYPPRLNQGLVILSLFFVSIFFPTTPSPCINGYTGYVEFSLSILLLVRLGQNEHPKSLLFSKTSDHVSELTCNKITVYPRELYIAKAAENCGFSLVVPIISRTPVYSIFISTSGSCPERRIRFLAKLSIFTGDPMSRTKISPPSAFVPAESTRLTASGMVMK